MRKSVFEIPIDDFSLEEISKIALGKRKVFQIFVNIHKVVLFHKLKEMRQILGDNHCVFSVDGNWIQFFANLKGFFPKGRFGGLDVIKEFASIGFRNHLKFYFLGGSEEVLEKALQIIKDKFAGIQIVGSRNGYFVDETVVIREIKAIQPDILFLALPSPRKEILGYRLFKEVQSLKYVAGVGGALDIIAGKFKRAPKIIQFFGMEWFWRCIGNRKLFDRYIRDFIDLSSLILQSFFRQVKLS